MAAQEKKVINLFRGWPGPPLLPAQEVREAAARALSDPAVYNPGLLYGPDAGFRPLRSSLANWLGATYNVEPDPARICITGGASQSLACLLTSFTDPAYTRAVWMAAPCYFLASSVFEDAGFRGRLHAVPEDDEGASAEFLAQALEGFPEGEPGTGHPAYKDPRPARKHYRHVIYVVPTCANPSGRTMTLRRRKELVLLARKHDALIICDDVYDLLQWKMGNGHDVGDPRDWMIPRLVDIDLGLGPTERERGGKHFGHAISNGSLSKLLGPGVRTGWVEGSPAFAHGLSQTAATVSGGAPSQLTATIVWEVLQTGALQRHVDSVLRPALQRRHALMMRLIDSELGRFGVELVKMQQAGVEGSGDGLTGVYGGYFVWIRFPQLPTPSSTTRRLAEWARESEDLIIAAGDLFEVKGDEATAPFPDTVRLCFSWEDEASIEEGMKRLGRAVESFAAREAANSPGENDIGLRSAAYAIYIDEYK